MRTPTWLAVAAATALALSGPAASHAATGHDSARVGKAGASVEVMDHITISGYDIASDKNGTAYLGFLGDDGTDLREAFLCVLPRHATSCAGGLKQASTMGDASSAGLHVVVTGTGQATLVWVHDGPDAGTDPDGAYLTTASYAAGVLSPPVDQVAAPSHATLLDVQADHHGTIWAVTSSSDQQHLQVYDGLGATVSDLTAPYSSVDARLAFSGDTAVLAIVPANEATQPVSYATSAGAWSAFRSVPGTWNVGHDFDVVDTSRGVRLIASEADADYFPVVSRLTSAGFATPHLTGDRNHCSPTAHDLTTDTSGRLADVSPVCNRLRLTDLPQTTRAAYVDIPSGGILAGGDAQLTTLPNGSGWIAYAVESTDGDKLLAMPIQLPALTRAVVKHGVPGYVSVRGPVSCLPATTAAALVGAKAARPWKLVSKSLTLDGAAHHSATVNGAALTSGSTHHLGGHATFHKPRKGKHPGVTRSLSISLAFTVC